MTWVEKFVFVVGHFRSRALLCGCTLLIGVLISTSTACAQLNPRLQSYFKEYVGLSDDQIAAIRRGAAFAKSLRSRHPGEIVVFGAIYIEAAPESYLALSRDYRQLRQIPGYLKIVPFSSPPQAADVATLRLDERDFDALRSCKPGDCQIQMPSDLIDDVQRSVNWSGANAKESVDRLFRQRILERLFAYQHDGNQVLGEYNDKKEATEVAREFEYLLAYSKALPTYLPALHDYLLSYPQGKPVGVQDTFRWEDVKFGLKPTFRVVHVITLRGNPPDEPAYAVAEKQLYSSHYFEAALDMTFCVLDNPASVRNGFYLIKVMGSEQAGLTGLKGSVVRKVALDRSTATLQKSLEAIKSSLEHAKSATPSKDRHVTNSLM